MNETVQHSSERAAGAITTAAFTTMFVYSLVVSLPSILINDVVETFSLEGTDEGLMGALTSFGFMLSIFFVVMVQGRAKKTTVLVIALAAQAIAVFACGFSPVFLLFCTACVFVGFSGGFLDTFNNSVIVDVRESESTKYLGYLHGLFGVGSLLSPLIFMLILRNTDWRGVHYVLAVASALVMLFVFIITRKTGSTRNKAAAREHLFTKSDLLAYMKIKRNITLAMAGFFAMLTIASVMVWIVRYMTLRYDAAEIGALSITVYWICATVNRFLLAPIIKRAPVKFFVLGAFFSGISLLIGVVSGSSVVFCVCIGIFGLCSGHFIPVLVSESAVGYDGRTTFTTSVIMFLMSLARIAAPIMMAFLSTQISLTIGMMLPITTAIAAMICGLFAIKSRKIVLDV